ncbi:MAG TPA: SUMF1/EgtB/PvdO family nonheme iron enzyme [Spirochaetota bacterium]|nr:SUMF1/EgtB/PvdO family nonheme iron enzyme [Spirochaetota bacterium]HQP50256.1 SUMF1/EgtB/PvdO family nonheme iron enzyme [Spirochaetota bacterium]
MLRGGSWNNNNDNNRSANRNNNNPDNRNNNNGFRVVVPAVSRQYLPAVPRAHGFADVRGGTFRARPSRFRDK